MSTRPIEQSLERSSDNAADLLIPVFPARKPQAAETLKRMLSESANLRPVQEDEPTSEDLLRTIATSIGQGESPLELVPRDIKHVIMLHCKLGDIHNLSLTSKSFMRVAQDEFFWKHKCYRDFGFEESEKKRSRPSAFTNLSKLIRIEGSLESEESSVHLKIHANDGPIFLGVASTAHAWNSRYFGSNETLETCSKTLFGIDSQLQAGDEVTLTFKPKQLTIKQPSDTKDIDLPAGEYHFVVGASKPGLKVQILSSNVFSDFFLGVGFVLAEKNSVVTADRALWDHTTSQVSYRELYNTQGHGSWGDYVRTAFLKEPVKDVCLVRNTLVNDEVEVWGRSRIGFIPTPEEFKQIAPNFDQEFKIPREFNFMGKDYYYIGSGDRQLRFKNGNQNLIIAKTSRTLLWAVAPDSLPNFSVSIGNGIDYLIQKNF